MDLSKVTRIVYANSKQAKQWGRDNYVDNMEGEKGFYT